MSWTRQNETSPRHLPFAPARRLLVPAVLLLASTTGCHRDRKQPDPHLQRGFELVETEPKQALAEFDQARGPEPDKAYGRGLSLEALGRVEEAAQAYDAALAANPRLISAQVGRARIDVLRGDLAAARPRLAQVIRDAPSSLPAVVLLAVTATQPSELDQAREALEGWPAAAKQAMGSRPPEYLLTLASVADALGKSRMAQDARQAASRAKIENQAAVLALAQLALSLGRTPLARDLLERLAESELSPARARDTTKLLLRLSRLEAAEKSGRQIPVFPEEASNLRVLGELHLALGDAARAVHELSRSAALGDHGNERDEGLFLLAQGHLELGHPDKAMPLLLELERKDPKKLSVQLLIAQAELAQAADTKQAPDAKQAGLERLTRLAQEYPEQAIVHERLALALDAAGRHPEAARQFRRVVELSPHSDQAAFQLATHLAAHDSPKAAVDLLQAAISADPNNPERLRRFVAFCLEHGQGDSALRLLEARARAEPLDEQAALLLASVYEKMGYTQKVESTLRDLTQRVPRSASAWLSLARLADLQNRPDEAIRALEQASIIDPRAAAARKHLAALHLRRNDAKAAAEQYEQLLVHHPSDAGTLNNLALLYAEELGRPERAVVLAEKAYALAKSPAIGDTQGWVLLIAQKTDRLPEATSLLRAASGSLPDPDAKLHYAVALALAGDREKSAELLRTFRFDDKKAGHRWAQALLAQARTRGPAGAPAAP